LDEINATIRNTNNVFNDFGFAFYFFDYWEVGLFTRRKEPFVKLVQGFEVAVKWHITSCYTLLIAAIQPKTERYTN